MDTLIIYYCVAFTILLVFQKDLPNRLLVIICWITTVYCDQLHSVVKVSVPDFYIAQAVIDFILFMSIFIVVTTYDILIKSRLCYIFLLSCTFNLWIYFNFIGYIVLYQYYQMISLVLFELIILSCIDFEYLKSRQESASKFIKELKNALDVTLKLRLDKLFRAH